jgi:isopentenyl diphosphate isomerase/L-lactate dehydrogenase-like FMN-dependent dehydrogenase
VTKALQIIHKELDLTMAFCGHTKIGTVTKKHPAAGQLPRFALSQARFSPATPSARPG